MLICTHSLQKFADIRQPLTSWKLTLIKVWLTSSSASGDSVIKSHLSGNFQLHRLCKFHQWISNTLAAHWWWAILLGCSKNYFVFLIKIKGKFLILTFHFIMNVGNFTSWYLAFFALKNAFILSSSASTNLPKGGACSASKLCKPTLALPYCKCLFFIRIQYIFSCFNNILTVLIVKKGNILKFCFRVFMFGWASSKNYYIE